MNFDAYVAGLVDGEGTIYIQRAKSDSYIAVVSIAMTTRALPILQRIHHRYGGTLRVFRAATDRYAEAHVWRVNGTKCVPVLTAIRPFLLLKAEQADIALRLQEMIARQSCWTKEGRADARLAWQAMKMLNRKGPDETITAPPLGMKLFALRVGDTFVQPQRSLQSVSGWQAFSGSWPAAGMVAHGACWTPSTSAFPNAGDGCSACSLEQILDSNVPSKYWLSPKACAGILRRATKRGRALPPLLENALRSVAQSPPDKEEWTIMTPAPAT